MMENEATKKIFDCIDGHHSFVYMSGAGSGKTTSLISSIDYVLRTQKSLVPPQQILAITFTNVAAERIKKTIGETSFVRCSTIHDALWSFIKRYKDDIRQAFMDVVKSDQSVQKATVESLKEYEPWDGAALGFFEEYRFHRYEKAVDYKAYLSQKIGSVPKNAGDCQKRLNALWKNKAEEDFLNELIAYPKTPIEYTPTFNHDVLYKGQFSHDTLLVIAKKVLSKGHIALKAFADTNPYIFVDEYQDTADEVIDLLVEVANSEPPGKGPLVGFFGDPAQRIYDLVCPDFEKKPFLEKPIVIFNPDCYRCPQSVLAIANKIRNDNVIQISIFPAHVSCDDIRIFAAGNQADYKTFVSSIVEEDPKKKWGCFLLKNDDIADALSFSNFLAAVKASPHFHRYYDEVKDEFLASEDAKLLPSILALKRMISFYLTLIDANASLQTLLPFSFLREVTLAEANDCLRKWMPFPASDDSFDTLVDYFEKKIKESAEFSASFASNCSLPEGGFSKKAFYELIDHDLEFSDDASSETSFGGIKIREMIQWLSYLNATQKGNVVYRTLHGTKGDEFDNVIIVMDSRLGLHGPSFHQFFADGSDNTAKNLLYVALTRTKGSIRLLYRDDNFSAIKDGFCSFFGERVVAFS